MLIDRVFHVRPARAFSCDVVTLEFRFKVVRVPDSLEEDENFPYEDEIFLVNVGETGKFTSDKIFQSKFTVFKDGGDLCCNGYAPDFARKSHDRGRFAGQSYRKTYAHEIPRLCRNQRRAV
ncbi:MAG: hypothetical protein ACLRTQ_08120 [Candidatus Borkfalkia sp.]